MIAHHSSWTAEDVLQSHTHTNTYWFSSKTSGAAEGGGSGLDSPSLQVRSEQEQVTLMSELWWWMLYVCLWLSCVMLSYLVAADTNTTWTDLSSWQRELTGCSCCWMDTVNVWDVSIGHSVVWCSAPKHGRFYLQSPSSVSVSHHHSSPKDPSTAKFDLFSLTGVLLSVMSFRTFGWW